MKYYLLLILSLLIIRTSKSQNTCSHYTLKLYSHFDGWSGNSLAVKINNNIVYPDVTFSSGHGPYIFNIPVNSDDVISILFKRNGSWADDCRYEVYDADNNLVAVRDGAGTGSSGGPENTYGLLACPSGNYCGVYVVELFDGYGNSGWGGSYLNVFINNVLTTSGTHQDLSYAWADREDISFAVKANDTVNLIYNTAPNTPTSFAYYYDSYKVFDENDSLITTKISSFSNNDPSTSTGIPNTYRLITCQNYSPPPPALNKNPFKNNHKESTFNPEDIQNLVIYPSPASDYVFIRSNYKIKNYNIYNRLGKSMKSGLLNDDNRIELSDLPEDIYYIDLLTEQNYSIRKLIPINR